jgi:hypothetical protein
MVIWLCDVRWFWQPSNLERVISAQPSICYRTLKLFWGAQPDLVSVCLERFADQSHWHAEDSTSTWPAIYLAFTHLAVCLLPLHSLYLSFDSPIYPPSLSLLSRPTKLTQCTTENDAGHGTSQLFLVIGPGEMHSVRPFSLCRDWGRDYVSARQSHVCRGRGGRV